MTGGSDFAVGIQVVKHLQPSITRLQARESDKNELIDKTVKKKK